MTEIIPNLFLGNKNDSTNHQIYDVIINCTKKQGKKKGEVRGRIRENLLKHRPKPLVSTLQICVGCFCCGVRQTCNVELATELRTRDKGFALGWENICL